MKGRLSSGGVRWAVLLLSGAILIAAAGCQARARSTTTALPTELRVGIAPDFPPLAFRQDGKLRGVEVDFAGLLGQQLGVKVSLVEMAWEELFPALTANKIDVIMSATSITEKRAEYVDFTVPYLTIGQMALVRRADQLRFRESDALDQASSRVGVLQNTTGALYSRTNLKQAKVIAFASLDEGVAALRGNQIDFFVQDAPVIWQITSGRTPGYDDLAGIYRPLTTEYLAWAVRQDDDILRRQLNATLLLWGQNGQLEDILDDWMPSRRVTLPMR